MSESIKMDLSRFCKVHLNIEKWIEKIGVLCRICVLPKVTVKTKFA